MEAQRPIPAVAHRQEQWNAGSHYDARYQNQMPHPSASHMQGMAQKSCKDLYKGCIPPG